MSTPDYDVFVAYISGDEDLKDVVISALAEQMSLKTKRAISDKIFTFRDAPSSEDWLERNTQAVARARVSVVLLTPNSIYSPWIHYEIGANKVTGLRTPVNIGRRSYKTKSILIAGLAKGLASVDLPPDVADFYKVFRVDFIQLDTVSGVKKFLASIRTALGTGRSLRLSTINSIVRQAKGISGWSVTSQCAHATRIRQSPFTFMTHLEGPTTRRIVDFGQNLNFLFGEGSEAADRRRFLLKQLKKKGGPIVEIIICDKDYSAFVQSWCDLMGFSYEGHLNNATRNLVAFWERYANYCRINGKRRRMNVYIVKVMPLSFTFINPERRDGLLFVKPQIVGEPTTRPIFCLSAANPNHEIAFNYYWGNLRQLLRTEGFAKKLVLINRKAVLKPVIPSPG